MAWAVLAVVAAWSVWYLVERYAPTHCRGDGCPGVLGARSSDREQALRYVLWVASLAFAVRAVGMPDRTPRGVLVAAALSVACFAGVLVTLGAVFPPLPQIVPGE